MSHKERIEALEAHMQTLGMEMQQRFDQMAEMLREKKKKGRKGRRDRSPDSQSSGSSSQSFTENDSDSTEDLSIDEGEEEQSKKPYKEKNKPKMTFPPFKGEDPISWLSRAQQFFSFQKVKTTE
ncbi:hypothetical protein MRB53_018840 [Persea americana]|uniref:Uncharacterized protein n=1 Tax=Persea americana TaxID=3435 RepID=A0ACC2M8K6_PERAE|nr:hypothetical protein MRB53_018840 [Persea americana]